jgi:hypothetical protein
MQNRYAGDIGDFSKFALLEALVSSDLSLGVIWYLNMAEETNSDGALIKYNELRKYNPSLFDRLCSVANGKRCIADLETGGVAPTTTVFFDDPLPANTRLDSATGLTPRDQWVRRAATSVHGVDVVFLDPDNGVAPPAVTKADRRSVKYAFCDEISYLLERGHSLVLYQHHERKPLAACISTRTQMFGAFAATWAISFHRRSVRTYFVMAQPRHEHLLWDRTMRLINSPIGVDGCFRLHLGSKKSCSSERSIEAAIRTA